MSTAFLKKLALKGEKLNDIQRKLMVLFLKMGEICLYLSVSLENDSGKETKAQITK